MVRASRNKNKNVERDHSEVSVSIQNRYTLKIIPSMIKEIDSLKLVCSIKRNYSLIDEGFIPSTKLIPSDLEEIHYF
jgi:hypothetical protein